MSVAKVQAEFDGYIAALTPVMEGVSGPLVKLVALYVFEPTIEPKELIGRVAWTQTLLGLPGQQRIRSFHTYFFQYERIANLFRELMDAAKQNPDFSDSIKMSIRNVALTNYCIPAQKGNVHYAFHYVPRETMLKAIAPWTSMFVSELIPQGLPEDYAERFRLAREIRGQNQIRGYGSDGYLLPESQRVWIQQITGVLQETETPYSDTGDGQQDPRFLIGPQHTHQWRVSDPTLPPFLRELIPDLRERTPEEACCQEEDGSCFCCWTFMLHLCDAFWNCVCCLFCRGEEE